ncbi:MAG TPA: hypothetical protein DCS93_34180 [Microscillaceae bacterium]|nr:hypothetical protein [Microscillaceae bacterium]
MKNTYIQFLSCFLISFSLFAQDAKTPSFEWPDHNVSVIFKDFLVAYNSNDVKNIEAYAQKYHTRPSRMARRMQQLFTQYGKLQPYAVTAQRKDRLGLWLLGQDTKNWIEVMLVTNKTGDKIRGTGMMRGMRPKGLLPPYKAMAPNKMKPHLAAYLQKLSQQDHFSGAVLVAKGDQILFEGAYGDRNKQKGFKNNLNTTFCLASTTKTFTAVAIAQLAEKGKLKFTDFISKYIPEYPKDIAQQVTIHHLLTHTSGIELDDYAPFNQAVQKARNVEDLLKAQLKYMDHMNENRRKNFKVLNKHDYSNENFSLLGVIIERVSGMSYAQYLEQNIFKPVGMTRSYADYTKLAQDQNHAMGYTFYDKNRKFNPNQRQENTAYNDAIASPAGGVYSSVRDLYKYFRAINTGQLLGPAMQATLLKKHVKTFDFKEIDISESYCYGFETRRTGKVEHIGHTGRKVGVGSRFEYFPAQDMYVIVLSNYGFPAHNPASHIRDLIEPND